MWKLKMQRKTTARMLRMWPSSPDVPRQTNSPNSIEWDEGQADEGNSNPETQQHQKKSNY